MAAFATTINKLEGLLFSLTRLLGLLADPVAKSLFVEQQLYFRSESISVTP